jgi:hypothetical protein
VHKKTLHSQVIPNPDEQCLSIMPPGATSGS